MGNLKIKSETAYVNFKEFEGDTLKMDFTWTDNLDAFVDLTGYTARMDIRSSVDDLNSLLSLNNLSGIFLGNAVSNIVLTVTKAQTIALGVGSFVYDIELTDTVGEVNTLIAGKIVLKQPVTR
jgi:hypothetical protein